MCFVVESEGSGECDVRGCGVVFFYFDKMFIRGNIEESMCICVFDVFFLLLIVDVDFRS